MKFPCRCIATPYTMDLFHYFNRKFLEMPESERLEYGYQLSQLAREVNMQCQFQSSHHLFWNIANRL